MNNERFIINIFISLSEESLMGRGHDTTNYYLMDDRDLQLVQFQQSDRENGRNLGKTNNQLNILNNHFVINN